MKLPPGSQWSPDCPLAPPTQPSTLLCSALPWTCALSQSTVESNGYRLLKGQKASLNCRGEGSQPWKSTVDGAQCLWLAVITVWWSPQLEIEQYNTHHWFSWQPRRTIKSVGSSKEGDKALDVNFMGEDLPNPAAIRRLGVLQCDRHVAG